MAHIYMIYGPYLYNFLDNKRLVCIRSIFLMIMILVLCFVELGNIGTKL